MRRNHSKHYFQKTTPLVKIKVSNRPISNTKVQSLYKVHSSNTIMFIIKVNTFITYYNVLKFFMMVAVELAGHLMVNDCR